VGTIGSIVTVSLTVYALVALIFLVSENRRPQATPAWMLVFFFVSGLGLVIYVLFGRDNKAFSRQRRLLIQEAEANARPLLAPILARQDEEIARLETKGASHRKLMMLARRNSHSVLSQRNTAEILQDAATRRHQTCLHTGLRSNYLGIRQSASSFQKRKRNPTVGSMLLRWR
jgi:cardiolipin synthase